MDNQEVTIIGAGPAGIAAAIQLKRWGITPLLLEKDHVGGLLINANLVENYPGFPDGIAGTELVKLFGSQMERTGVQAKIEEVIELDWDRMFKLRTNLRVFHSRIVVIASGTSPTTWDSCDIGGNVRDRVLYEVHSIAGVRGKRILIVGAGDAAFDYALSLSDHNEITIINRVDTPKCLPLLWERMRQSASISYRANATLTELADRQDTLVCKGSGGQGDWELAVDYVIFAIGRVPQLEFLAEHCKHISVRLENEGLLYFAGDVSNDIYRQTSIAVGDGVKAAMRICRVLEGAY